MVANRLSVRIDHEFQKIRIGIAHIDACALGAAVVATAHALYRAFDDFRASLIEGGAQRLRRAFPHETEIATTRDRSGPAQSEAPALPALGRMEIDLVIAEMHRIKMFSFFHFESQASVKFQHRLGVLDRYCDMIKALNRHLRASQL